MTRDLSTLRSQVLAVAPQIQELLETFLAREPLLPGSLYTLRRRCGKPTCHCAQGELHASTVLSYRGQGRPQNITPPRGEARRGPQADRRLSAIPPSTHAAAAASEATALAPGPSRSGTRARRRTPVSRASCSPFPHPFSEVMPWIWSCSKTTSLT